MSPAQQSYLVRGHLGFKSLYFFLKLITSMKQLSLLAFLYLKSAVK